MTAYDIAITLRPPAPLALNDSALFLDLDGTLAPIAARPQDVRAEPRRTRLLEALRRGLDGRIAILSGRTLGEVDRILEGRVRAVAAVHGLVRRDPDGEVHEPMPHPALADALATFESAAERDAGLLVENKGLSVALHYRLAPQHQDLAVTTAERLAADTGLLLQPGHMVVELRTPGPNKGDSLRRFMHAPPFAGARPVFVGDDVTDEPGFAAAAAMGGFGVLVGQARSTAARWRLPDVESVLAWLEGAR